MASAPDFAGKVAIVTGGASGIGRATALAFAECGARVVVADIAAEPGRSITAEIESAGGKALFHRADVTVESDVKAMVATTVEAFGRLDFAHNNAGFSWGRGVEDISEDDWNRTINLCLKAPWLCLKHQLPVMVRQGAGAIVNTASMAGVRCMQASTIAYSAAKAGVIHMTRYAARSYAKHGIRVNAVSPGLVRTPSLQSRFPDPEKQLAIAADQPIARPVEPREVAAAVIWLCSEQAAMVTGDNIHVAGGL